MARFLSSVALGGLASLVAGWDISVKSTGGNATSGHQYGFLHEDINHSGDGGIYAELIRNRAFQYTEPYFSLTMDGWYPINDAELSLERLSEPLSEQLPVSIKVAPSKSDGKIGFYNDGFWGMDVKQQTYTGSFWVRGAYDGVFTASLQSNLTDDVFGTVEIESRSVADDWIEHEFELMPTRDAPNSNNTFALTFDPKGTETGSLDFNLVSLFPPTYKNRKNGLRIDLAEVMEGLHPKLLRFPGGGMLQGHDNDNYWDWKDTLGPLRYRKGFAGRWGYHQTHGLGIMEYLQWAEDMDLVLMPVVWAGAAFDDNPIPPEELQPYIDDALNQVEFIRGSVDTPWGARRAELGHPEPFKLQYLQISNEDWLPGPNSNRSYIDYRFPMFLEAVTEKYPDLQVISSMSPFEGHDVPAPAWADYHPYRKPDELVEEFDYMDNQIPHIVGEVAATHVNGGEGWSGAGRLHTFPWWIGTVGEAISMIGYERNADRVATVLYAPVIRNMNSWAWAITIIQFAADPAMTTRSTSWYLWELFADHLMTTTLPTEGEFDPLFYVAGRNEDKGTVIWKGAVYNTTEPIPVSLSFEGVREGHEAVLIKLTAEDDDPFAYNDPHLGNQVVETEETILVANEDGVFEFEMTELSIAVLETRPRKCIPRPRAS